MRDYYNRFMVTYYMWRIRKSCNIPTPFWWFWTTLAWYYIKTGKSPKDLPNTRLFTWEELEKFDKQ